MVIKLCLTVVTTIRKNKVLHKVRKTLRNVGSFPALN